MLSRFINKNEGVKQRFQPGIVFIIANERINHGSIVMNHDPLQCLVTRVMPCGKFDLMLALMPCKGSGNWVCEYFRAWPLLYSPFLFYVRYRTSDASQPR